MPKGFLTHLAPLSMVSFVERDYRILASRFRMRKWAYRGRLRGIQDRAAIYLGVRRSDFNVSWFAYNQAFWAVRHSKNLGRKSLVVIGGFDVSEEEDPRLQHRLPTLRYVLRHADCLLALSEHLQTKVLALEPTARVELLYPGFDATRYAPAGSKAPIVTTISFVRHANLQRKGLETFVRAAANLPALEFLLIGEWLDDSIRYLRGIAPPNVSFAGWLPEPDLIRALQQSAVYVQASLHEGFGCSLAEAMLCGCVPVVSARGAIPEVVGDVGIYVDPASPEDLARGIRGAFDEPERGYSARERVARLFPLGRRGSLLISKVEELLA